MSMPNSQKDLEGPVAKAAKKINRTYHRSDMHEWMVLEFNLTNEERWMMRAASNNNHFNNMVDWAHRDLVVDGVLEMVGATNSGLYRAIGVNDDQAPAKATTQKTVAPVKAKKAAKEAAHKSQIWASSMKTEASKWDNIFGR